MSSQDYVGTAKRTFKQAMIHLLETGYGLVGSRRVLELMADDIETLVDEFCPVPEHLRSGWMVFTGTKASGSKAHPGQSASDHELVTLAWPVLLPEDIQALASLPKGPEGTKARVALTQTRLVRIIEYGWDHPKGPVLLTLGDLSAMLSISTVRISELLADARRTTGKTLCTKGYYFDQGMRPTHKTEIVGLYEAGVDEADIARRTGHSPASVGQYIRDYERVKLLLTHHTPVGHVGQLIQIRPTIVKAYVAIAHQHHPDLLPAQRSVPDP